MVNAAAQRAPLRVMISGGFAPVYQRVLSSFEMICGVNVHTASGASQGSGPNTIAAALARDELIDVVIMSREGLADLQAQGKIRLGSDFDLAVVELGAGVHVDAPKPDISTVAAFKAAVLQAGTVVVPGSTSGIFLREQVFPKLGLSGKIKVLVRERGSQCAESVAMGEAGMALLPVSELLDFYGVSLIGRLPEEVQLRQVFCAAITANAVNRYPAIKLTAYLASSATAEVKIACGMELVGR